MRLFKKLLSIVIILTMVVSGSILVNATETEQVTSPTTDIPSSWAIWNVQMASIYGLGSDDNYKGFTSAITGKQFLAVQSSFEQKFSILDDTKIQTDKIMTRGDVVNELYDTIELILKLEISTGEDTSLNYFLEKGLLYGKNGEYALDDVCTQQEMLTFSQRVYEFLIYELELDAKGAFWEVSDGDNTVYLLGSVHATDGSVFPLSKNIMVAFFNSAALAVEANILIPNPEETAYMQQVMMLEGESTLEQLISEEMYEIYSSAMQSVGMQEIVYNKLKPWAAAMIMQSIQLANASYSSSMGIDVYFLSLAYGWKPIIELEGTKFQVDMFDSFSSELQKIYFESSLESNEESEALMGQLMSMWKKGDVEELEKLVFAEEATTKEEKELNNKMWETRNENMLAKVDEMLVLDSENDYFIIVGAGHMLNDNGLVQGLKNLGYSVKQVK